ncbi:MAG TPA: polysaccharide deacetylase family protein [Gemmatimonadales bacterium]|nr:polysaccharide deacetylase family protein [Gemmatimonadales bacterium]
MRRRAQVIPLRELLERRGTGRSTAGLAAITFDDGYIGLVEHAYDFFRSEQIPTTVFVVTRAAESGSAYWWDRVEDVFPHVTGERWARFEEACGLPDEYRRHQPASFGPLRPLRQWILARHSGRWPASLESALRELEEDAGLRTGQRAASFEELDRLAGLPWVDFGVHTVSHPVLPLLPDEEVAEEIRGAHDALRARFDRVVNVLAAPFGLFDERTLRVAREVGMAATMTLDGGSIEEVWPYGGIPRICMTAGMGEWRLWATVRGVERLWRRARGVGRRYPELPGPRS